MSIKNCEFYNKQQLGFWRGVYDMLPLSIVVIPWGVLAGATAIHTGLNWMQALGMSVFVFAGAAQLVSLSMISAGASVFSIIVTIFFLTSQHFIYALHLREESVSWSITRRLSIGFLLTDELYATAMLHEKRPYRYLLGAGISFYLCWVICSLVGIYLAEKVSDLSVFHFEFSIIVIFLVITIKLIKNKIAILGIVISAVVVLILTWLQMEAAILLAGLCGMFVAAYCDSEKDVKV